MARLLALAIALGIAVVAVRAPLALYAGSLATFGLAHVLSELRYVDARFGARLPDALRNGLAALLCGVVFARTCAVTGALPGPLATAIELGCVAILAAAVAPGLLRERPAAGMLAVLVGAGFLVSAALVPLSALILLAAAHNLTPLGFLWDRWRSQPADVAFAILLLVGIPLIIATGAPGRLIGTTEFGDTLLGPLGNYVGAYVPPALRGLHATDLFCAAVYGQIAHYVATIGVLPASLTPDERPTLPWPGFAGMVALIAVPSAVLLVGYALSFEDARSVYGIAAAVHAWIEVPILLIALGGPGFMKLCPPK